MSVQEALATAEQLLPITVYLQRAVTRYQEIRRDAQRKDNIPRSDQRKG
jgi:hypothetical protein